MPAPTALSRARAMGADHGRSLALHLEPGDKVDTDSVPFPLSGEWAGDPLPADILAAFEGSGMDDDDILNQYEEGFFSAYEATARSIGAWIESV